MAGAAATPRRRNRPPRRGPGCSASGRQRHVDDGPIRQLGILQRIGAIVRLAMRRAAVEHQVPRRVQRIRDRSKAARGWLASNARSPTSQSSPRVQRIGSLSATRAISAIGARIAPGNQVIVRDVVGSHIDVALRRAACRDKRLATGVESGPARTSPSAPRSGRSIGRWAGPPGTARAARRRSALAGRVAWPRGRR